MGKAPATIVSCFADGGWDPRGRIRHMYSAMLYGCFSWQSEPAFLGRSAHSRKDKGTEMALVAGGPYELCMTTQIPAPALLMIESGHGMLPSSLWSL